MEYRPVPEAHRESFRRLVSYAFDPASGPDFDLEDQQTDPETFDRRGLYRAPGDGTDGTDGTDEPGVDDPDGSPAGDNLAAVCGVYRFTLRVRDDWHPAGALAAVASAPETRRRGYVSEVLDGVHRELRDDGTPFAVLWPFAYPFYRRHGYEQIGRYGRLTVPPEQLSAVAAAPAGEFVRLGPDDWAELDAVHAAWATESLAVDRTAGWWRHRVFEHWSTDPYVYGWRDAGGDLRGYVVYVFEGDGGRDDRTMVVRELAATDPHARRQCLRFLRDHDSQVEAVRLADRSDRAIALQSALDDPRAADLAVRPGPMLRAVDLRAAVEAVPFPPAAEATLTLAVRDGACPWNDGTFELTVADGTGRLEPASADTGEDVDVAGDVGALSAALVGAIPVRELAARSDAGGSGERGSAPGSVPETGVGAATGTDAGAGGDADADAGAAGDGSPTRSAGGAGRLTGDDRAIGTLAACCPAVETYLREGF